MTITAVIRNDLGDVVVDFTRVLYRKSTGVCMTRSAVQAEAAAQLNAISGVSPFGWSSDLTSSNQVATWLATPGGLGMAAPGNPAQGISLCHPVAGHDDLVFLQPGAGGFARAVAINMDLPGLPGGVYVNVAADSALPYTVVSPVPPPVTPAGHLGLRIRDPITAQTLFDSRWPQMSIFMGYLLTADAIWTIFETGAPLTITLPRAAPGAWVCAPYWVNEWFSTLPSGPGQALAMLWIRQTSPTTLVVERRAATGWSPLPGRLIKKFATDTMLMIGRDA